MLSCLAPAAYAAKPAFESRICEASAEAAGARCGAHLDGLNLSRAWMLEGIVRGLKSGDRRILALSNAAQRHREAALPQVTGEHYEGGHWLGTFAVYLLTGLFLPQ